MIFIAPDERDSKENKVINEFIREFSRLLKNNKNELICNDFIFPSLKNKEWNDMWEPVSEYIIDPMVEQPKELVVGFTKIIKLNFPASFTNVYFGGGVNFADGIFNKKMDFRNAKFMGTTIFFDAQFKSANFTGSMFRENAYFTGIKVNEEAYFIGAKFGRDAYFESTEFGHQANFMSVKFNKRAHFKSAKFGEKADFENAEFNGDVDLQRSLLFNVSFRGAKFSKVADFSGAIVKFLDFTKCEIFSYLRIRAIQNTPSIFLRDLRFWENGCVLLEDFDVSRISFWQSNFHIVRPRIDFIRVNWGENKIIFDDINKMAEEAEKKDKAKYKSIFREFKDIIKKLWKADRITLKLLWSGVVGIIKDLKKKNKESKKKAEEIERVYRQIRLIYEGKGQYPDAGDFYLLEMKARGKRFKLFSKTCVLKILHCLYGLVSKYGESVGGAVVSFIGIWIGMAILFAFLGFEKSNEFFQLSFNLILSNFRQALEIMGESIIAVSKAIFLGRIEPYDPVDFWSSFTLNVLARILGLSAVTLLLLAIRRRFRR